MTGKPVENTAAVASAGVLRRGVCYLIDSMLAFGVVALLQMFALTPLRNALGIDEDWFRSGWNTELYTLLTISLPVWSLFAAGDCVWRSPGRRLTGSRVLKRGAGAAPSFGRAFVRAAVKLLPWEVAHLANNLPTPMWYAVEPELRFLFPVSGMLLLGWALSVALRRDHRGPHDLLTGTEVVSLAR